MTNSWKKRLFAAFVALSMMVGDLPASFIADSGRVYAEANPETVQAEALPPESSELTTGAAPEAVLAAENDTQEKEIPDAPLEAAAGSQEEKAVASANQEAVLTPQENAAPEVLLQGAAGDASVIPEEQQPASDLPQETVPEATEVQSSSELPQEPAAEAIEVQSVTPETPEETPDETKQTEVDSEKMPESDPSAADGETPEAPTNPETMNGPEVPQEQVSDEPAAVAEPAATEPEEKQDNQETEKTAGAEAGNETPSETAVQEQQPEGENPPQPTGNDGANQPQENHPDQPQQQDNGQSAGGETAPTGGQSEPQIPVIPMDAEMEVGDEEKVSVSITGAMVRLKVSKKDTLIMTATGMEAWVDIVKEGEKKSERYMPENGELTVRFEVTPGSYIMTFAPVKDSDEGKLTIRVRTEEEVLAELLGEGQDAESDENGTPAGEEPGTTGEAPAGEGAGEGEATGADDGADEGDLNGANEEAGEAGQDELTGEAGDALQNGEGSQGTDETGDAPQNGEGEQNGETGAAPENGEAGEGTDETGDNSGEGDVEQNPQGGESVSFDEALAALEGKESEEEKTPADNAETWQAADEDAGDITFIDNAEQPAPAAQEKPEGEENAAQDVEPKDGQSEEPISPDELNPDQEATPSDSEADGEAQPETQETPEVTEVDGDDLNISAYSAEQADAMALALGLKPRLMMKNAGLRQKNTLSIEKADAPETEAAENAVPETVTETGFAAFDISLKEDAEVSPAGAYLVHVNLSEPVVLPQKENMEITGVSYELYHIPSDSGYPTRVEAEFHDSREEGLLYGFTFETDGFSDYLLKYTVDFTYIVVKPEEPEEESEVYDYEYTFGGKGDTQPLGMILAANELFLDSYTATAEDDALVTMDEDLNVTAVKFFDATVLTVTDDAGTEYRILLHNPAPAAPEPTEVNATVEAYDESATKALVEQYGLGIEVEEENEDKVVNYAAFNISLPDDAEPSEGGYIVPVTLETHIDLPAKEGTQNKVTYELFHITENGPETVEILSVTDNDGAGPITGFTFKTDGFSNYVLRYTVDFVVEDEQGEVRTWSFPGGGDYALEDVLSALGIEYETIENASLELTETVGEKDVDEEGRDALYIDGDSETGYVLHSYAAFDDVYTLNVLADTRIYVITVTDDYVRNIEVEINFYESDQTAPATASFAGYLMATQTNASPKVNDIVKPTVSDTKVTATLSMRKFDDWKNTDDVYVLKYTGDKTGTALKDFVNSKWDYDESGTIQAKYPLNGSQIGAFSVSKDDSSSNDEKWVYKAVKQPSYDVEIKFVDSEGNLVTVAPSGLPTNYTLYVTQTLKNNNNQDSIYYHKVENVNLNAIDQSFAIVSLNGENPNTKEYDNTADISVRLGIFSIEGNANEHGHPKYDIYDVSEEVTNGSSVGLYEFTVESADGKTTFIGKKADPYKYNITSSDTTITFDEQYSGYWYLLSKLIKGDGTIYYKAIKLKDNGKTIDKVSDQTIDEFWTSTVDDNGLGQVSIGNEGTPSQYDAWRNIKTTAYRTSDTVENFLIRSNNHLGNYKEIIQATEQYGSGSVINKYSMSDSTINGVGTITLTKLPDLRLHTVFKEASGEAATDPGDYKLLIKMVQDGNTYYALQTIGSATDNGSDGPIVFYQDGDTSNTPHYYSGSETLTTQVVTGANTAAEAVSGGNDIVKYNENTVNDTVQNNDLTKNLYSSSSTVNGGTEGAPFILTTTFTKQQNDGVEHDITVNYYKDKAYPVLSAIHDTDANPQGTYYFLVKLYKKDNADKKTVAYKIVQVTESISQGKFTQVINGTDSFQLADDNEIDIANADAVFYDPTVYYSNVRLYKLNDGKTMSDVTNIQTAETYGSDTYDDYQFWYNKPWYKTDAADYDAQATYNGEDITKTQTQLGLISQTKKVYQVKVYVPASAGAVNQNTNLKLNVTVSHASGDQDKLNEATISTDTTPYGTNGSTATNQENVDGKDYNVITYLLEDQRPDSNIYHWSEKAKVGENYNPISGNETYDLWITQNGTKIGEGYPVKIGSDYYTIEYDTRTQDENGIFIDDTVDVANGVTTITHYVRLEPASYDGPLKPTQILGDAAEYGIVANCYRQTGHTETNFAVNNYYPNGTNIDIDGSGDGAMPWWVGKIHTGELWISSGTAVDVDLHITDEDYASNFRDTTVDGTNSTVGKTGANNASRINPIIQTEPEINSYVNGLISAGRTKSNWLASQTTIAPTLEDCQAAGRRMSGKGYNGNSCLDTTMFPDSITIYVDCSNIESVISGNWNIAKRPNQSIVFNLPSAHAYINEFNVYELDENYNTVSRTLKQHGTAPNPLVSTTSALDGNKNKNQAVDEVILEHITFNCYKASSMELHNASALFLVPNGTVESQENGAGWILAGGCVKSGTEWHFYRHERTYTRQGTDNSFKASKFMNRLDGENNKIAPNSKQKFTFVMEKLNRQTGNWETIASKENNGSVISFPEIKYSGNPEDEDEHYYRIRELTVNASNVEYDDTQYIIKTTVTGGFTNGNYSQSKVNEYWRVKDGISPFDPELITEKTAYIHKEGERENQVSEDTDEVKIKIVNNEKLTKEDKAGNQISQSSSEAAVVFVNTYVGKYCVAVTKKWDDRDNRDGVRPDSIEIKLEKLDFPLDENGKPDTTKEKTWQTVKGIAPTNQYDYTFDTDASSETYGEETTVPVDYALLYDGNNWTHMVKGVDKYNAIGEVIPYRWVETAYIFNNNGTKVRIDPKPNSTTYTNDADGNPTIVSTTFEFYYNGTTVSTNGDEVDKVVYTGITNGIDTKTSPEDGGTITYVTGLTNRHQIKKTNVRATKVWKNKDGSEIATENYPTDKPVTFRLLGEYTVDELDDNNQPVHEDNDTTKPIKTRKYEVRDITDADGNRVASDITLPIDNNGTKTWIAEWNNLPKYYNGHEIRYYVVEVSAPFGYSTTYGAGTTVINDGTSLTDTQKTEVLNACTLNGDTWTVTINNTEQQGSLVINKSVIIDNMKQTGTDKTGEKVFYVTISRTVEGDGTYYVTSNNGTLTKQSGDILPTGAVHEVRFLTDKWTLSIPNLPYGSYTVTEVVNNGTAEEPDWQAVNADNAAKMNIGNTQFVNDISTTTVTANLTANEAATELLNAYTNSKYCVAVTKQWILNGTTYVDDTLETYVQLQMRAKGESAWTPVTGVYMGETVVGGNTAGAAGNSYIKLSKANNWSAVAVGMDRKNENGVEYEYQWVEGTVSGTTFTAGVPAGWTLAGSETVQSKTTETAAGKKDGVELIFLTKLVNTKATAQPQITKTVTATYAEAPAGTYTFTLEKGTGDNRPTSDVLPADPATVSVTMPEVAAGKSASVNGVFGAITYIEEGTYTYTISETVPADGDKVEGMVYDTKTVTATVEVTTDENGKLTAGEFTYTNNGTFTNEFKPAKISIPVKKAFSTAGLADDAHAPKGNYVFTIEGKENAPLPAQTTVTLLDVNEVTAEAARTATFADIVYTKVGTYTYEIKELLTDAQASGWKYDTKTITATVTVTANSDGSLGATVEYADTDANADNNNTFTNTYELVKISATKTWDANATNYGLKKDVQLTIEGTVDAGAGKTQYITEYLAGSGDTLVKTIPANAEDTALTVTWENLPKYYDGKEIAYKVVELNLEGFTTTYSSGSGDGVMTTGEVVFGPDNSGTVTVTNTAELGALEVSKTMLVDNVEVKDYGSDVANAAKQAIYTANKDQKFYIAISYKDANDQTWYVASKEDGTNKVTLTKTAADKYYFELSADSGSPASKQLFTGLPFGTYTVTEFQKNEKNEYVAVGNIRELSFVPAPLSRIADEVTVDTAYDSTDLVTEGRTTEKTGLINAYTTGKYCIAVTKQWLVNGKVSEPDDDQVLYVKLQRSTDDTNWTDVTGIYLGEQEVSGEVTDQKVNYITLNKANNWSAVAVGMKQMDEAGNRYSYRWVELKTSDVNETAAVGDVISDKWIVGNSEQVQTATKDGKTLIFLTKLVNSRAEVEIPVRKEITGSKYNGNKKFEVELTVPSGLNTGNNSVTVIPSDKKIEISNLDTEIFEIGNFVVPDTYTFTLKEIAPTNAKDQIPGMVYFDGTKEVKVEVAWYKADGTKWESNGSNDNERSYLKATVTQDVTTGEGDSASTIPQEVTEQNPVVIENKLELGELKLTKKFLFEGSSAPAVRPDMERVSFVITGYDTENTETIIWGPKTVYLIQMNEGTNAAGAEKTGTETIGEKTYYYYNFTTDGANLELDQLPYGTYKVEERVNGEVTNLYDFEVSTANVTNVTPDKQNDQRFGFGADANVSGTVGTEPITFAFVNQYKNKTADLQVTKTLVGALAADANTKHTITVTLAQAAGKSYDWYLGNVGTTDTEGNIDFTKQPNKIVFSEAGVAELQLKGGEVAKISGLPAGATYTVEENPVTAGFTVSYNGKSAILINGRTAEATVTNTKKTAKLDITKVVDSSLDSDKEAAFTFAVTFSEALPETVTAEKNENGTPISLNYEDGATNYINSDKTTITIDLKDQETLRFYNLPIGIKYTITESSTGKVVEEGVTTEVSGFTSSIKLNGSTVDKIEAKALDSDASAEVTNTRPSSDLAITKTVVSPLALDNNIEFEFTVYLTYADGTEITRNQSFQGVLTKPGYNNSTLTRERAIKFTAGTSETIYLKHDETMTIKGIPDGYKYYVVEKAVDGFTTSNPDQDAQPGTEGSKLTIGPSKSVKFTNSREDSVLRIYKTVVSNVEADHNAFYQFTARFTYTNDTGSELLAAKDNYYKLTYYDKDGHEITGIPEGATGAASLPQYLSLSNGIGTVYVYADGYTKIEKLPIGTDYTLIENIDSAFEAVRTQAEGEIKNDGATEVNDGTTITIQNEEHFTNTRRTGDLHVSKSVKSDRTNDLTQRFDFRVTLMDKDGVTDTTINGDYGTYRDIVEGEEKNVPVHFVNGVATFKAKDSETVMITGLPVGIFYKVEETDSKGMVVTQTGQVGSINGGDVPNTASFTNIRDEGGLIISKSVVSSLERDKQRDFKFKVQMFDVNNQNATPAANMSYIQQESPEKKYFTDANGYIIFDSTKSGDEALISYLKDGDTLLINGLPDGAKYIVTEESEQGFDTTIIGNGRVEGGSITGVILKNSANLAEFINERKPGVLKISKKVVSPIKADETKTFRFNIKLYDEIDSASTETGNNIFEEGGKKYKYLKASIAGRYFNGSEGADFYVMGKQTLVLEGIPLGVHYIVTEYKDDSFEIITPVSTDEGYTILPSGEVGYTGIVETSADSQNGILLPFVNERNGATLKISKIVESAVDSDKETAFTYTILFNESITDEFGVSVTGEVGELADATKEGLTGKVLKVEDGKATITLKHGASLTVNGLPTNTTYTVVETANNDFDAYVYNTASTASNEEDKWEKRYDATGTINTDPVPEAKFKNTRKSGSLELKKIVSSTVESDEDIPFTFDIVFDRILDNSSGIVLKVNGTEKSFTLATVSKVINGTEKQVSAIKDLMLKHNDVATISGLPIGVTYWISEQQSNQDGFATTYTGETGTISAATSKSTFTNTKQVGGLIISKSVDSAISTDKTVGFTYTVTLTNKTPAQLGIDSENPSKMFGALKFENVNGKAVATFTLKDGQSTYAINLPDGTEYEIVETIPSGYDMTAKGTVATMDANGTNGTARRFEGLTASDTVYSGATDVVAYTNTRATENLTISKKVVSDNPADKGKAYSFTVKLTVNGTALPGSFGEVNFDANGEANITLHGDEKLVLPNLPVGTTYSITENSADGFIVTPASSVNGTIIDTPVTVEFTNTREKGNLTITKNVSSTLDDDATREYKFHIYLDADITRSYATTSTTQPSVQFTQGVSEVITLKKGESITIQQLPTGVHFIVEEEPVEGMSVQYNGVTSVNGSGVITKSEATVAGQTITVTNTRVTKGLEIDKKVFVNDEDKTSTYSDKTFYVKVKARIGGETYWVTNASGTLTKENDNIKPHIFGIIPGTATGQKVTLADMPVGEYTVYEVVENATNAVNVDGSNAPKTDMGKMLFVADLSQTADTVVLSSQMTGNGTAHIVNKYTSEQFSLAVTKNWVDDGNKYNTRPDKLVVTLSRYVLDASGAPVSDTEFGEKTYELKAANNWTYLVTDVDQFDAQGREYHYVWTEKEVPTGYKQGVQQEVQVGNYARTKDPLVLITKLNNSLVNVDIPVKKIITGNPYTGNETFKIKLVEPEYATDGDHRITTLPSVIPNSKKLELKQNESGTFTLKDISEPGTYIYRITETDNGTAGMTYAADGQPVTIEVGWNSDETAKQTHLVVKSIKIGDSQVDVKDNPTVTVENKYETGSLEISKTVISDNPADQGVKFNFTVVLKNADGTPLAGGTYGGVNVPAGGIVTIKLHGGDKAVLTGLPVGTKYTVTETAEGGFTTTVTGTGTLTEADRKAEGEISTSASSAAYVNTREKGNISISKTVESPIPAEENKEFMFTVLLNEKISGTYDVTGGTEGKPITFTDGKGEIPVKGGETKTIVGLPQGVKYTVVEAIDNQFTADHQKLEGTFGEEPGTVAFTNRRKTGDLTVHKTVKSSIPADATKAFTFTVTLTGAQIKDGTYGDMTFDGNTATVVVAGGETKTATGLPTGIKYDVTEVTQDGYVPTYSGKTGTICLAPSHVYVTNTKDEGGLIVSKSVVSDVTADKDTPFSFTVALDDKTINGTYGEMSFEEGTATFTLKDGESKSASGLPEDIGYTVTEDTYDLFNTTSENAGGKTAKNASVAAFTNTRKTGSLEISKTVVSSIPAERTKAYTFDVELSVGEQKLNGTYSGITFEEGKATVTVLGGESMTITGLPVDTAWKVTEKDAADFTTTANDEDGTEAEGSIDAENEKDTAAFENTRKVGDISISKTVESPIPAEADKEFTFTVLLNEKISGEFDVTGGEKGEKITFTDGKGEIAVKGGETKTIVGLPQGAGYTVEEAIDNLFIAEHQQIDGTVGATESTAAFKNTRKTGELEVTKTVNSSNAADKTDKSFSFTVTLSDKTIGGAEGKAFGEMTFRKGVATFKLKNGEKATASGLPTGIDYTVTEEAADGFVTTSVGEEGTICLTKSIAAFTNTKSEGGLVVSKKVLSAVDADHETEYTITVTLDDNTIAGIYGDAEFTAGAATLKLKDGDTAVITGLPAGMGYKVKETLTDEDAEAFTIAYNGKTSAKEAEGTIQEDKTASAKVTNIRKTAELTITKKVVSNVAADRNGEAFLFTVELTHGGKAVDGVFSGVTFENGIAQIWLKHGEKAALKGLPYGTEYSVQEATPDRFTRTVEGGETGKLTEGKTIVAYTNTAEYVEKTVKKVWEDNSDSYGKRPKSIAATLKANGEVLKTVVLNKENKWTWTETKLPRYSKGREILYAWEETDVPDGYVMESEAKGNVTTITNTFLTGKLKITKTFSDNVADNPAVKKLTFTIVGPGLNKTVEYSEFRKGEYLLENLIPGVYAVVENNAYGLVSGYTLKAADSVISANGIVTAETDLTLALKNVYEEEKKTEEPPTPGPGPGPGPQTGTIVIRKVFTGMTELDDPGNLTFRILGPDGYDERVPYSQFTDGAYTISGLKPGQYLVYEMNAAVLNTAWKLLETSVTTAGGEVAVGQETVFELQNDYEVPTTSTGVMKVWDDMDNLDGSRPASLSVALLQDGRVIRHAALSEGNGWKAEITGLPLFNAAGAVIQYSWREEEVPGYVLSSQIRLGNATVLKNTHKPEVTSVSVTKIWDDNRNEAGLRPASLRVRLSNGTNYTLNAANGWSVTVENLPKYVNGEEVRYTWSEQSVLGYTLTDVRTVGDTTIFTNSYRMPLPPTEDGTPNTGTRLHILEDYGTPLGIEILINHVGDCYE